MKNLGVCIKGNCMKKKRNNLVLLLTLATSVTLFSTSSFADGITVGFGAGWTDSPYKGTGSVYTPVPSIKYDNGLFYLDTFSAGVHLYNQDNQTISAGLSYLPLRFKRSDSDDHQMKQLNKRNSTMLANVNYKLTTQYGIFTTRFSADVLNESNSMIVDANYSYAFSSEKWRIVPAAGINWVNDKHNDYYYGISNSESARSGLAAHHAKNSLTPYVSLMGHYAITPHIGAYTGLTVHQLTGDAKNSPMVAHSTVSTVFTGLNYTF